MTTRALHKPEPLTQITIAWNLVVLLVAVFLPKYHQPISAFLMRNDCWRSVPNDKGLVEQSIFVTGLWLIAANLSSIFSVILVNYEASMEGKHLRRERAVPESCTDIARRVDTKLTFVWGVTWIIALFLVVVIVLLIFDGPSPGLVHFGSIATGGVYLTVIFLNDLIGHSAIKDCQTIREAVQTEFDALRGNKKTKKGELKRQLDDKIQALSFFTKVVFLVDIPILVGLLIIYLQKYGVLQDDVFRLGFSTGAIAMHVIAANLVSIMLSIFNFRESQPA